MSALKLQFHRGGIYLPALRLWLDPHDAQEGPDRVFVSHAHSDHIANHREVILSRVTARLMQNRLGGERVEHVQAFGEPRTYGEGEGAFQLTLLPAGHIFGSAMAFIEVGGKSVLYTGDFKLRRGLSAEPCEPRPADVLVMETTFGRPQYQFPPTDEVMRSVIRFCREALDNEETPVLLGYSLGKSQELLCGLAEAGLPLMLHDAVHKLTKVYEEFGQCFPKYESYEAGSAGGKVLICPPHASGSAMLRKLGKVRTAVLTGWAVDANVRYRYGVNAAFPISDHADFPELLAMVEQVRPKRVYTLHGFAADFAQVLRERGVDAWSLSETEQMALALEWTRSSPRTRSGKTALPKPVGSGVGSSGDSTAVGPLPEPQSVSSFARFAGTCVQIAANTGKLEKIRLLSEYLATLPASDLSAVAVWFTGLPFAATEQKVLQLGWAVLRDSLCMVAGIDEHAFHQVYLKHSDLGETAWEILTDTLPTAEPLMVSDVAALFAALHALRGPVAKRTRLAQALRQCTGVEAKFLVKVITSDLRIGLKEGLVEEAVAKAFSVSPEAVRQANLLLGHIGEAALLASQNALNNASLVPFRPVKFMLASPVETAAEVCERMRERAGENGIVSETSASVLTPSTGGQVHNIPGPPLWIEDKYDGIRCQLHKVGDKVCLYSRDLKEITRTFFDVAGAARQFSADVILDGEIVAMRGDTALPFSELQKRLGRREDDLFLGEEIPIKLVAFDLLWRNGETWMNKPFSERHEALAALAPFPAGFRLATITPARTVEEVETAFTDARGRNNEGIMIKDPVSVYSPGRRGLAWLKLKKALATLDCVVVGAEYGHGKRKNVLSDYTFAVRDETTGELKIIGKAYSGLTDAEIAQLTRYFLDRAFEQRGRYFSVPPEIVLEIAFDRIQASNRHSSGLALRFPRIARIRTDKTPADIDTLATARKLAESLKSGTSEEGVTN